MAHGSPDWVRMVQVAVTVNNAPIVPTTAEETAIDGYGTVTTDSSSYQTVSSWTVGVGKVGILRGIEINTDNFDVAQWRVTVAGVQIFNNELLPSALEKVFPDLNLEAGDVVLVEVKSDGSTSLTAYADIDCKEVG